LTVLAKSIGTLIKRTLWKSTDLADDELGIFTAVAAVADETSKVLGLAVVVLLVAKIP